MKVILFLFCTGAILNASAQTDRKYIYRGNKEFENRQYKNAEVEYRKALDIDSNSYRAQYNLANSLYNQENYSDANNLYNKLIMNEKANQALNRYYYNQGNTWFKSKEYQKSIDAYINALKNDPADMDAKHNLQLALKMLAQENQQKQNQDQKDQNQEKNKNNQNSQNKQNEPNNQNNKDQQKQQAVRDQISKENAERILQALENEEKNVIKRVQDQKQNIQKASVEKDW